MQKFSIDDSKDNKAYDFIGNNKKIDKETVLRWFLNRCASKDVTKAFCYIDSNEKKQFREGLTTYGVETKNQELLIIYTYEKYNNACKDEINMLNSAVKNAQERIKRGNTLKVKLFVGAAATILAAGGIKLAHDHHIFENFGQQVSTESNTEDMTEVATPVTTTEEELEFGNLSGEDIKESFEESLQNETNQEIEDLQKNREELGLNPDSTTPTVQNNQGENVNTEFQSSYGYNEIFDNAEKTQAAIDEYNQYENQRQLQELEELRKSYEEEYKVKSH